MAPYSSFPEVTGSWRDAAIKYYVCFVLTVLFHFLPFSLFNCNDGVCQHTNYVFYLMEVASTKTDRMWLFCSRQHWNLRIHEFHKCRLATSHEPILSRCLGKVSHKRQGNIFLVKLCKHWTGISWQACMRHWNVPILVPRISRFWNLISEKWH